MYKSLSNLAASENGSPAARVPSVGGEQTFAFQSIDHEFRRPEAFDLRVAIQEFAGAGFSNHLVDC